MINDVQRSDRTKMLVLAIETSCDDTGAAVVEGGRKIVSNVVSSQIPVHQKYGGVVPELASRKHIESIVPIVAEALREAEAQSARLIQPSRKSRWPDSCSNAQTRSWPVRCASCVVVAEWEQFKALTPDDFIEHTAQPVRRCSTDF